MKNIPPDIQEKKTAENRQTHRRLSYPKNKNIASLFAAIMTATSACAGEDELLRKPTLSSGADANNDILKQTNDAATLGDEVTESVESGATSDTHRDDESHMTDALYSKDEIDVPLAEISDIDMKETIPQSICETKKTELLATLKPGEPECSINDPDFGKIAGKLVCAPGNDKPNCNIQ